MLRASPLRGSTGPPRSPPGTTIRCPCRTASAASRAARTAPSISAVFRFILPDRQRMHLVIALAKPSDCVRCNN